jgi:hypothetical protein
MGLKQVFKKVSAINEVTELASHQVELANITDLVKLTSLTEKSLFAFTRQYKETKNFAKSTLVNADDFQNNKVKMYDLMQVLEKQAKDLGIDIKKSNEFIKAINLLTADRDVEKAKGYLRQVL